MLSVLSGRVAVRREAVQVCSRLDPVHMWRHACAISLDDCALVLLDPCASVSQTSNVPLERKGFCFSRVSCRHDEMQISKVRLDWLVRLGFSEGVRIRTVTGTLEDRFQGRSLTVRFEFMCRVAG